MSRFVTVAKVDDVPENGTCGVMAGDLAIALIRSGGEVYALEDCCSHEEFPLSDGEVEAGEITCLLHGARFDLATGAEGAPGGHAGSALRCADRRGRHPGRPLLSGTQPRTGARWRR